jgi:hypothetical protein
MTVLTAATHAGKDEDDPSERHPYRMIQGSGAGGMILGCDGIF